MWYVREKEHLSNLLETFGKGRLNVECGIWRNLIFKNPLSKVFKNLVKVSFFIHNYLNLYILYAYKMYIWEAR